jgi:hypothetical protein
MIKIRSGIKILSGSEHHAAAARHHEEAAVLHRQASEFYANKDYARAARQSLVAHGHTRKAVDHSHEATTFQIEQDEYSAAD